VRPGSSDHSHLRCAGFTHRRLLALPLAGAALAVDRALNPLMARLSAYRTLVVLEKGRTPDSAYY